MHARTDHLRHLSMWALIVSAFILLSATVVRAQPRAAPPAEPTRRQAVSPGAPGTGPAQATEQGRPFNLYVWLGAFYGGAYIPAFRDEVQPGAGMSLGFGYLADDWGFDAAVVAGSYSREADDFAIFEDVDEEFQLFGFVGDYKHYYAERGLFQPFWMAGAGFYGSEDTASEEFGIDTLGVRAGAGIDSRFWDPADFFGTAFGAGVRAYAAPMVSFDDSTELIVPVNLEVSGHIFFF